jgi:hypothetical protein
MNGIALLSKLIISKKVRINNTIFDILAFASYSTVNSPEVEYVKVALSNHAGFYFVISDETPIYFFKGKRNDTVSITEGHLGNPASINIDDVTFTVVNNSDYQYLTRWYRGDFNVLEGEVLFSDYESRNGSVLSLGLNKYSGKRDDVLAQPLGNKPIFR